MISPEIIRRYPFFAGLSHDQIVTLAKVADDITVEAGHYFFREGDDVEYIYLVLEGAATMLFEVPDQEVEQKLSSQLTGDLETKEVVVSVVGPGEVFGWSGMVAPHQAAAGAKATTECRVVAFDAQELTNQFQEDCEFGYLMMQKVAQIVAGRLRDIRIESLSRMIA
jgi:CRP/FNR family cyclic AMP-dependent transcriptional regulator